MRGAAQQRVAGVVSSPCFSHQILRVCMQAHNLTAIERMWAGASILARGVQRSKVLPALFDTLATRNEGVLLICPDGRSASAFVSLSHRKCSDSGFAKVNSLTNWSTYSLY